MKTLLLDRDGTINRDIGRVQAAEEIMLLPGVTDGLRRLQDAGYRFFIVTNQAKIGEGKDTEENFDACQKRLLTLLSDAGVTISATKFCPHPRDAECDCRKPRPGMWRQLQRDYPDLTADETVMVGDKDIDVLFGKAIGARTARLRTGQYPEEVSADMTITNLTELADLLNA